jgi:hypothetical protein
MGVPVWRGASLEGERRDALAVCAARDRPPAELAREVKERPPDHLIDELVRRRLPGGGDRRSGRAAKPLTKRLVGGRWRSSLSDHLGYEPHQGPAGGVRNTWNRSTPKMLLPGTRSQRP